MKHFIMCYHSNRFTLTETVLNSSIDKRICAHSGLVYDNTHLQGVNVFPAEKTNVEQIHDSFFSGIFSVISSRK